MDPAIARQLEGLNVEPTMIPPGGFHPISPTDAEAVEHARIAVEEYNKLNGNQNLRFVSIVKGQRQMAQGPVYDVVITARDAAANLNYYHLDFWMSRYMGSGDGCKIHSVTHIHYY